MASSLDAIAASQASAAEPVLSQPSENRDLRPLFRSAASAVAGAAPAPVAITVYSPDGTPLAWAGRPSELTVSSREAALPPGRFAGPSSLFVAPGPLGFRLVRVEPVLTGNARPPARVGLVAVERLFSELASVGNASADALQHRDPARPRVAAYRAARAVTPVGGAVHLRRGVPGRQPAGRGHASTRPCFSASGGSTGRWCSTARSWRWP